MFSHAKITFTDSSPATNNQVVIGPSVIAEVTETIDEYLHGLQGRSSLADGRGMLFVFPEPRIAHFWMSQVPFPLDMIFIDECGVVVFIARNVAALSLSPHGASGEVQAVLEVPGGWCDRVGVVEGAACVIEDFLIGPP